MHLFEVVSVLLASSGVGVPDDVSGFGVFDFKLPGLSVPFEVSDDCFSVVNDESRLFDHGNGVLNWDIDRGLESCNCADVTAVEGLSAAE